MLGGGKSVDCLDTLLRLGEFITSNQQVVISR